jgi:cytoskeletal protein RodZ
MESQGRKLKEARENKNITLKEASYATKIGIRFLKALENDEYDIFPSHIYLRSFLKNYVSFLELDGEKFSGEFKSVLPPVKQSPLLEHHISGHAKKVLVIFAVMLSIWLIWVIYQTVVVKF